MIENLVIGAIGSFIASIIFILALYRLRPSLTISPKIAKTEYEGKTVYSIKVLNSGSRDVIDIATELLMIEPQVVGDGVGRNILQYNIVRNEWFVLHPSSKVGNEFGGSFEFITVEN